MTMTDEMLIAYLGGKLSEAERLAVEAAVEDDPTVAERLRRHREVGAMIQDAISAGGRKSRGTVAGDGGPASVVSLAAARRTRQAPPPPRTSATTAKPRKPLDPRWAALIAGLVVGVAIGLFAPRPTQQLVDGDLFARAALAATLERRLQAEQKPGAPVRILATYQAPEGGWCRTFDSKAGLSGIACRGRDGWRVQLAETGVAQSSAAQVATIRALKLGAPVDAATERKGRAAAWR